MLSGPKQPTEEIWMNRILVIGEILLRWGVIFVPITCIAGIFLMTADTDETWILFGARGLVEHGRYAAGSPYNSVQSTGGLHTVFAALLHLAGDGRIEAIRLLSVFSVVSLLLVLRRWALYLGLKNTYIWLLMAAPLWAPGTLLLGSLAHGAVLAFLLVIIGLILWGELEPGSWKRRIWTCVLLGTAAATRVDCVFALFAPLAASTLISGKRTHLADSAIIVVFGGLVFLFQFWLLLFISDNLQLVKEVYGIASPLNISLGYWIPLRLAFWSIGQNSMSFVLAVLVSLGWRHVRSGVNRPYGVDALLVFGWLAMLAWLLQAPIPHLRYLWPSYAAFACVGTLTLALMLQSIAHSTVSAILIGIALLFTGYMDGARAFMHGESDILSWEFNRRTPYSLQYGPFRHHQFQRAIVSRIHEIPLDEPIATIGFNSALSFLTRRPIVPIQVYYADEKEMKNSVFWRPPTVIPPVRPRWIVITPIVNRFPNSYMSHQLYNWIQANCRVAERQGPYVLYEVLGTFPAKPDSLSLDMFGQGLPLLDLKLD